MLVVVAVVVAAACDPPIQLADGAIVRIAVPIPSIALPPGALEPQATVEIPGLVAPTALVVVDGVGVAVLAPNPESAGASELLIRVTGGLSAAAPVVLFQGTQAIDLAPGVEINVDDGALARDGLPHLDVNRNGRANVDDLESGCDPAAPAGLVRISADDVQLQGAGGRQVLVIDNTAGRALQVEASVIDAPGVGVSVVEAAAALGAVTALPTTELVQLEAGASLLVAVSFEPVNAFLATGFVAVDVVDSIEAPVQGAAPCGSHVELPVRVIANVNGALTPVDDDDVLPALSPGAELQGLDADAVESFPLANLASGEALGVDLPATPSGKRVNDVAADRGFLVEVPRGSRLALALASDDVDVDLGVVVLGAGDVVGAPAVFPVPQPLGSVESAEVVADALLAAGEGSLRVLVTAGTSGATEAAGGERNVRAALTAHIVSAPRFTVAPSPSSAPVLGGARVTLVGNAFGETPRVRFGLRAAPCEPPTSAGGVDTLVCTAPPGSLALEGVPLILEVGDAPNVQTAVARFTYDPAQPRVDAVDPGVVNVDGGAFLIVRGFGFTERFGRVVVAVDGVPVLAQVIDETAIEAVAPAHGAGLVPVSVTVIDSNGAPLTGTLADALLYELAAAPPPTLTSLNPPTGPDAGGAQITVIGRDFQADARVLFDGVEGAVVLGGPNALLVITPAHAPGAVDVDVVNPDGQSDRLAGAYLFAVDVVAPPDLFSITPGSGASAGGEQVTLLGAGFQAGVRVFFDDVELAPVSFGASAIVVQTVAHAAGVVDVRVQNADGQTDELVGGFRFVDAVVVPRAPLVVDVSPAVAHALVGGEVLTLFGQDLDSTISAQIVNGAARIPADIVSLTPNLLTLVVDDALPESIGMVVELVDGAAGVHFSPPFDTEAPTPLSFEARGRTEEGSPFTLVVSGVALNPSHLIGVRATPLDPLSGSEVTLPIGFGAETLVSVDVPPDVLGRGAWILALRYDNDVVIPIDVLEVGGACPGAALCALCGDAIRDPGEQCDGVDFAGKSCLTLGFDGGELACVGCQLEASACTACGNGLREAPQEQCDGVDVGGLTCASVGFTTGTLRCNVACGLDASQCARCGDGVCGLTETNASCAADCPAACGNDTCEGPVESCGNCPRDCDFCAPYRVVVVAGGDQLGPITGTLAQQILVRVEDDNAAGVDNVVVTFSAEAGDFVTQINVPTNGQGEAAIAWSLGVRIGLHELTVSATSPDGTQVTPAVVAADAVDVAAGTIVTIVNQAISSSGTFSPNAIRSPLGGIQAMALEANGDLLIADDNSNRDRILRWRHDNGVLELVAGGNTANGPSIGNGLPALQAGMASVNALAVGPDGTIYFSENNSNNDVVRRIQGGIVEHFAGGQTSVPLNGDGGPATQANLCDVDGMTILDDGDVLITDPCVAGSTRNHYRRVDVQGGSISTITPANLQRPDGGSVNLISVAGPVFVVDDDLFIGIISSNNTGFDNTFAVFDATANQTSLSSLNSLDFAARSPSGLLFAADTAGNKVFAVDGIGGRALIAGNGGSGNTGDLGPSTAALIGNPDHIVANAAGDLIIAARTAVTSSIRMIRGGRPAPSVSVVVDGGDLQTDELFQPLPGFLAARLVSTDPAFTFPGTALRFRTETGGQAVITAQPLVDVAGRGASQAFLGRRAGPQQFFAELPGPFARLFPLARATFTATAEAPLDEDIVMNGLPQASPPATLPGPRLSLTTSTRIGGLAIAPDGKVAVTSAGANLVWEIDLDGTARILAGTGAAGETGDGGPAAAARLNSPRGLAYDQFGRLFIAVHGSHCVRRVDVDAQRTIQAVAGVCNSTLTGGADGGPATGAATNNPRAVAVDDDGGIFLYDFSGVRYVDPVSGNIRRVITRFNQACGAGQVTAAGFRMQSGDTALTYDRARNRVLAMGVMTSVNAGCPVPAAGTWFWDISGGVFDPPAFLFGDTSAASGLEPDSLSVRDDGAIFYEVGSNVIRPLRVLRAGETVPENVPGAPLVSHMALSADGVVVGLDTTGDSVHFFEPPL